MQVVLSVEKQLIWCGYWIGLGILSSVGLGTGLHTFLLYLVSCHSINNFVTRITCVCSIVWYTIIVYNVFIGPSHLVLLPWQDGIMLDSVDFPEDAPYPQELINVKLTTQFCFVSQSLAFNFYFVSFSCVSYFLTVL